MKNFIIFALFIAIFTGCENSENSAKADSAQNTAQTQSAPAQSQTQPAQPKPSEDRCLRDDVMKKIAASKSSLPYKNGIVIYTDITCENNAIMHYYEFALDDALLADYEKTEERLRTELIAKSSEMVTLYCKNADMAWYRQTNIAIELHYRVPGYNDELATIFASNKECK